MECRPCAARGRLGSSRSPARQIRARRQHIDRAHWAGRPAAPSVGLDPRSAGATRSRSRHRRAALDAPSHRRVDPRLRRRSPCDTARAYPHRGDAHPRRPKATIWSGAAHRLWRARARTEARRSRRLRGRPGEAKLHKVRMGSSDSQLSTYIANRSPGASSPVDDRLRAITSTHRVVACCCGPTQRTHLRVAAHARADGDYPARVASILEEQAGYHQVIFLQVEPLMRRSRRSVTPTASRRCWPPRSAASRPSPRIRARR